VNSSMPWWRSTADRAVIFPNERQVHHVATRIRGVTDVSEPQYPSLSSSSEPVAGPPRSGNQASPLAVGAFFAVALALTGGVIAYTMFGADERARGSAVEGVEEWEGLSNAHVPMDTRADYEMYPPAGGEHYDAWQNCGVYEEPLRTEFAVHSQEHGAVWITHDPNLDRDEVQRLHDLYTPGEYIIVSPMEGLPAPVVASGWETQIRLEGADDPRIGPFLRQYVRSRDVPEPGAPCSGMFDGTEVDFDAERTPADLGVERDGDQDGAGGAMP